MYGRRMELATDKTPGEPFAQEQWRKAWLDEERPNATVEVRNSRSVYPGKPGRAAEADQPRSAAKVGFSKIHNFDRPLSKPDVDQLVTPWRATVRKGDLQQSPDDKASLGKETVASPEFRSKYSLSKVEAQAALQRQITSGNKIDWNEVRNLRKIIAESDS
mmetsp:Transcript_62648/g.123855  ORF Transcript_62648/g.123855 Transcript_62648/m.123855 type:complete len:161 (+) Transcript_62648:67-549(+)